MKRCMLTRDQILAAARELPAEEQRALAKELLEKDPEVESAWAAEAVRRREEVRAGLVKGVPAETVLAPWTARRLRRAG